MSTLKIGKDVTSDGYTFLAVTLGSCGEWLINVDLQQAILGANCGKRNMVQVFYGKRSEMRVNDFGNVIFSEGSRPVPIGLFLANKNTIKFLKPDEVYKYFPNASKPDNNSLHQSGWLKEQLEDLGQAEHKDTHDYFVQ
jgi:hypothetical protein